MFKEYRYWKWSVPTNPGSIKVELFLSLLGKETVKINDHEVFSKYAFKISNSHNIQLPDGRTATLKIEPTGPNYLPNCILEVENTIIPTQAGKSTQPKDTSQNETKKSTQARFVHILFTVWTIVCLFGVAYGLIEHKRQKDNDQPVDKDRLGKILFVSSIGSLPGLIKFRAYRIRKRRETYTR